MDRPGPVTAALSRRVADFAVEFGLGDRVCVGLSGGTDSLALTAACVAAGLDVHAVVVDHRLQPGSHAVAATAAAVAAGWGATSEVIAVDVDTAGGPEAAARRARYAAFDSIRDGRPVLLAHTRDDQAETVLLGLARGSGLRSIAGMAPWRAPWGRPLLGVARPETEAACTELGIEPYRDPHNVDPRFTRVRLRREVLPLLEDVCQGGVAAALARTADQVREADAALDEISAGLTVDSPDLARWPVAIRTRVVRGWLLRVGATEPSAATIEAVDRLVCGRTRDAQVAIGGDREHRLVAMLIDGRLQTGSTPR
ncbi:tRNA lysidine(34) synthetase TilS [Jongsikchunia kroppenstedtii]|uniref:tRNA lysidine(34) synthetase TilS n=1 Tax=Jongsikchunia kroppenstedtii TaxID=1121721 RepID=UPI00037D0AB9|nr:tRNA lysidine(34) synthetase TilS [Jongsikchunia kroppenstedtii]